MSEPSSSGTMPDATAAAAPPDDPPDVRLRSSGLLTRPWTGLSLCQSASHMATLVLPRMTAPAALSRATAVASLSATQPFIAGTPQLVGRPGDVERFLHRHRQAEQGPAFASRKGLVRRLRRRARAVEIADHDGVDRPVETLDPLDRLLAQPRRRRPRRRRGPRPSPWPCGQPSTKDRSSKYNAPRFEDSLRQHRAEGPSRPSAMNGAPRGQRPFCFGSGARI